MSHVILLLRGGRVVLDLIDVAQQIQKPDKTTAEKAKMVAKSIFTFFETTAVTGHYLDANKTKLMRVHAGELVSRIGVMMTEMVDGAIEDKNPLRIMTENLSSIIRIATDTTMLQEQVYLELPDDEFKNTKRPIYEHDGDGGVSIVGYEPLNREDCQHRIENAQGMGRVANSVEIISKDLIVQTATDAVHSFEDFCIAARETQVLRLMGNGEMIPEAYHEDPVLRELICPISLCPIRSPLRDPTSGTIYEAPLLIGWVLRAGTSPLTRERLSIDQLQPCPEELARINARIEELNIAF